MLRLSLGTYPSVRFLSDFRYIIPLSANFSGSFLAERASRFIRSDPPAARLATYQEQLIIYQQATVFSSVTSLLRDGASHRMSSLKCERRSPAKGGGPAMTSATGQSS